LDVSGSGQSAQNIAAGQAAGVSFTLTSTFSNVSISTDVLCIGCSGSFFLLKDDVGSTATLANLIDVATYDVTTSSSPLFTGLTLDPGDYFLFLALTGDTGAASWTASDPPTVFAAPGVFYNFGMFGESVSDPAFRTDLEVISTTQAMDFRIEAAASDEGSVPEPATWLLMILGFGLVGVRVRSVRRTDPTAMGWRSGVQARTDTL
jgi:hypothetical protein